MTDQTPESYVANLALTKAEKAFDLASGFLAVQVATLKALAAQGAVNEGTLRVYLTSLLNDLRPEEREAGYGACLSMLVAALEGTATGVPSRPN